MLKINSMCPDFQCKTTEGDISFHDGLEIVGVFYFLTQKILHQFVQQN